LRESCRASGEVRGMRRRNRPVAVRHGVRAVRHVAVECIRPPAPGLLAREPAAGLEVETFLGRVAPRRPRIPRLPLIVAGLERDGLRDRDLALILEEVREPRRQNSLLTVPGRGAPEVDVAKLLSFGMRPAAVAPG